MVVNWKKNVRETNLKERRGRGRERGDRSLNFTGKSLTKYLCGVLILVHLVHVQSVFLNFKKLKYRSICSLVV